MIEQAPDAVPGARRFAASALPPGAADIRDDVELVVAELVTNALLHGEPPIQLSLTPVPDGVRVAVEDAGHRLPLRLRAGRDSMTGRGLGLVAALAARWGVEPLRSQGKVVWAELSRRPRPDQPTAAVDLDVLLAAWTDDGPSDEVTFTVELGAVPTDLLLEAKTHIDNLVREFTLAASGASAPGAPQLPAEIGELVQTVVHDFCAARAQLKQQASAAAARGAAEAPLRLTLPASAADAGERYLAALDEADRYARAAQLLTLETPPVHRVFRRWYVQSLVDQLRGAVAGRPPGPTPTFPQRLAEELAELVPLREVTARLVELQRVTAELTGAAEVVDVARIVVRGAVGTLGASTAMIYLATGDRLQFLAGQGGDEVAVGSLSELPLAAELPGPAALRSGSMLLFRDRTEIGERFPALAGRFPEDRSLLIAPLIVGEHRLGMLSLTYPRMSRVSEETQATVLSTLADVSAQAFERALASASAAQASERLAFLAEASIVLSSSLDYRTVLEAVANLVVPRMADWCAIQLVEHGVLQTVALTAMDPDRLPWAREFAARYPVDMNSPTGAPNVARTGVSELYAEISPDQIAAAAIDEEHLRWIRDFGLSSLLIVPLTGRTGVIGVLTMISAESGRQYDDSDVAFAEDLARRAALAVETAQAFREQSGRLASVTRIAEAAQHAILAPPPPQIGPVALAARYVSAATEALIGGDLYEVVERPGAVRLLIGDVRGKGLDAVRTATVVLGEFRSAAADVDHLGEVAAQIDRRVRRYLDDEDFVTALVAEIGDDGRFTLAGCGHPPAIIASAGSLTTVETPETPPLGLGATPTLVHGRLSVGDRLLLYTDGLVEARDPSRRMVDPTPLLQPLVDGPLELVPDLILEALRTAVGGALADDLALLVAEYRGRRATDALASAAPHRPERRRARQPERRRPPAET